VGGRRGRSSDRFVELKLTINLRDCAYMRAGTHACNRVTNIHALRDCAYMRAGTRAAESGDVSLVGLAVVFACNVCFALRGIVTKR
jgi:hypothetical protein